uniref:SHC (Src homology 2 domain containing) transforming protein 2 n=1 Tax=Oryzias melastigma TaxID=30732 RepID=A0A3B3BNW3_ORYME
PKRGTGALADSPCLDGEQDATTTFCMLIPRMPQWKFSNSLLSRSPSSSSKDSSKGAGAPSQSSTPSLRPVGSTPASGAVASLAAVLNSCDPVCVTPCSLQAIRGSGMNRRTRGDGVWPGGEDLSHKGSFINKPSQGWLHPDKKIAGPGASYIVRYMGCIEVLKSMRSLDFNTRTHVTREAINRLCEAVPGGRGVWRKKVFNKALQTVMGKSNLRFAGMSIAVNISVDGLGLLIPTTRQVIAHHPMQSISFASGGDSDTPDYVAYVAKDPVNKRACHILECSDGLAQSVISTIGQAFELQFKQYLHSPPKTMGSLERYLLFEEAWGDEEDPSEHDYYNSIPGKEPPIGGVVDSRLRPAGALLGHIHTHDPVWVHSSSVSVCRQAQQLKGSQGNYNNSCLLLDGYLCADGQPTASKDYEEHQYVNTQSLEHLEAQGADGQRGPKDSPKKDLFDMRPFEDALKLHEACGGAASQAGGGVVPVLEDQWPSPPRRRAPVAPNEEQLRREPWYHSRMSRRDAEKLLVRDGDFLVRESTTNPGQYVLTGMHCGLPKHLLLVDPEGVVRTKDMLFESISHLISYHLKNGLPIVAAESELHLKQVVRRKQ